MAIDIASETWSSIRKTCEERIRVETETVLRPGLAAHEYDTARGAIAAFRTVLALSEPIKVEPAVDYSRRKDRSGI